MNEIRSLRSVLVWIVPFAIVLAILGWETDWGDGVSIPVPVTPPTSPQPVSVALMPEYRIDGALAARRETVDRTLFNPTRRPAPPADQAAGGKGTMQKGLYALTGTSVAGNVATAFLRELKGGKTYAVRQGDRLNGTLISEVRPDRVRLSLGDDHEDLVLKVAVGPKTTVQPVAVGAQPGVAGPGIPGVGTGLPVGGSARNPPGVQVPPPGAVPGAGAPNAALQNPAVSVSELLAQRRAAAAAAAANAAQQTPRLTPSASDPGWNAAYRRALQGQ